MGGSGIVGDVVAAAFNDELPVPITVLKQIRTPAFVGPETLAIAVSYSGDTEETVSMATAAVECGARFVAVSRGGELFPHLYADLPLQTLAIAGEAYTAAVETSDEVAWTEVDPNAPPCPS